MNTRFEKIVSNTLSANGNQTIITGNKENEIYCGLVYIKIFRGGSFNYHFVFSGIIDSTFADGTISKCNDLCDWTIESLCVAVAEDCIPAGNEYKQVFFDGKKSVHIGHRDYVFSDSIELFAKKDNYICLKIEFSGKKIPCHKESIIPIYRLQKKEWILCPDVPVPVLTGIEYSPEKRIAFLGDSITQGIGSTFNSYKNFAAIVGESLGEKNAYWNLGLGYGRGSDAASNGIWLEKAKKNDIVVVCYGVNDIFQEKNEEKLKKDLKDIVLELKNAGVKVLIQTVPPFDYSKEYTDIWYSVNEYIKMELSALADGLIEDVPVLSMTGDNMPKSKYGPHPNDAGCQKWAELIVTELKKIL